MYMPIDYGVMSMQIEGQHIKLNIPYIHVPYSHSTVAIQEILHVNVVFPGFFLLALSQSPAPFVPFCILFC